MERTMYLRKPLASMQKKRSGPSLPHPHHLTSRTGLFLSAFADRKEEKSCTPTRYFEAASMASKSKGAGSHHVYLWLKAEGTGPFHIRYSYLLVEAVKRA
jgi:hypothetical protein